jgi:hypothetical protein
MARHQDSNEFKRIKRLTVKSNSTVLYCTVLYCSSLTIPGICRQCSQARRAAYLGIPEPVKIEHIYENGHISTHVSSGTCRMSCRISTMTTSAGCPRRERPRKKPRRNLSRSKIYAERSSHIIQGAILLFSSFPMTAFILFSPETGNAKC